jgi:hypothetical protein
MKRVLMFGAYFYLLLAAWAQPSNAPVAGMGPMITFDTRNYAFGKVVQGDLIRHDFVVSNAGNQTLNITDVHPSCGCTTAGTWPHELAPGKSGLIPIQINTKNLSSAIKKTVTVTSNDRHSPTILQLSGEVVKSIDVTPAFAMFHLIMGTTNIDPAVIKISNRTEQPLKIKSATSDSAAFRVTEVKTLEEGKEYQISVAANPPFARGTNGTISVSTGWSNYVVRVPAYLTVQPAIIAQPRAINVPAQVDHEMAIKITLYSMRPEDQFSDPKSTDDRITVSLTNSTIGKPVYTLKAMIPVGYRTTPGHSASITVKTTDAQMPVVTIPVMQAVPYAQAPQPVIRARQPLPAISATAASPGPTAH